MQDERPATSDGDFRPSHVRGAAFRKVTFLGGRKILKNRFFQKCSELLRGGRNGSGGRSGMVSGDRKWVGEVSKLDIKLKIAIRFSAHPEHFLS